MPAVLPSPYSEPAEFVAWALQNPLLLAKYPQKLAATRAAFEAGQYTGGRLQELAMWLYEKRIYLRSMAAVTDYRPGGLKKWSAVVDGRDTTDCRLFTPKECTALRRELMLAHSTELDWLGGLIQAAHDRRMLLHLESTAVLIADPAGDELPF